MVESSKGAALAPVEPVKKISMAEFLESCPPNQQRAIAPISEVRHSSSTGSFPTVSSVGNYFVTPEIQLFCTDDACNGPRFFRCTTSSIVAPESWTFFFLTYKCSNCQRVTKKFSVAAVRDVGASSGTALKIGEIPPFGPNTPARLIKLVGPDRELFLQGRRCENQGLGIGAFVYYRRVLENQKNRILSEILKVATRLGASGAAIAELEAALKEDQFSKALDGVKHGIPQTLLINGQNPLLLLHDALSDGVHGRTDAECLELATSVRVILVELADRLSQALKDEVEINTALERLAAIRSKRAAREKEQSRSDFRTRATNP